MKAPLGLLAVVWLVASPPGAGAPVAAAPAHPDGSTSGRGSRDTPAALLSLSDEELARRVELDVATLGSMSIGTPGSALLINPVAGRAVFAFPGPVFRPRPRSA